MNRKMVKGFPIFTVLSYTLLSQMKTSDLIIMLQTGPGLELDEIVNVRK